MGLLPAGLVDLQRILAHPLGKPVQAIESVKPIILGAEYALLIQTVLDSHEFGFLESLFS